MDLFNMTLRFNDISLEENITDTASQTLKTVPIFMTGSVSLEEYQRYVLIFAWVKAVCQPFCLICLLLSAIVFLRKEMRNATTCYLVALNLCEAYYVSQLCILQICKVTFSCVSTQGYTYFSFYGLSFVGVSCRRCVYIFNCLVAVQRFLVVAFPMSARQKNILQKSVPVCIATLLLSLGFHVYLPLTYEVVSRGNDYFYLSPRDIGRENADFFESFSSSLVYLLVYTPLLVGAIANVGMAISLKRHTGSMSHVKSSKEGQSHKELQTNIVVLVSTGLFFLFSLPVNINLVVRNALENYGNMKKEQYLYLLIVSASVISGQVLSDLVIFISYLSLSSAFQRNTAQFLASLFCLRSTKNK